ncbi:hypothetical protein GIY62_20395 [Burkholderia plantarii]|uniref:hypothetical protein n=1 Tax=Burkholderia plantarii TaxID=41899 RepID=UPI00272AAB7F|nr:hypothetical protein [Burkholderia plantarii]WLE62753.1 hypothetical protein GIY62_20395 [Burkholderia plantarii]
MKPTPGIFVATPAYGSSCYLPYVTGLLSLQRACLEAGLGFEFFYVSGTALLHQQRNVLIRRFLDESTLSHLLFVDADVGFEGRDVLRMHALRAEIALGPYPAKQLDWQAVVETARRRPELSAQQVALAAADYRYTLYAIGDGALQGEQPVEVAAGGAGLMLLERAVFEKLALAYPDTRVEVPEVYRHLVPHATHLHEHFEFLREPNGRALSEDLSFCRKWRDLGGAIYACPWFRTTHAGVHYFDGNLPALLGRA